jgi:hypothetical protein
MKAIISLIWLCLFLSTFIFFVIAIFSDARWFIASFSTAAMACMLQVWMGKNKDLI